jgi:NAD(P)-dependent dehydrogenase (short-subunit alcohol dehydrogenase family)
MATDNQQITRPEHDGRVAIVAGAGGELGRPTAATLAAAGFTVVGIDRNKDALSGLPEGVRAEVADPVDPAQAKDVINRVAAEVGSPRVLVNALGAFTPGDALATTPDSLQLMMDVNLGAALWLSQAAAAHMQQAGSGVIIHVSARPGVEPSGGMAAYGISKAALVHLTRVLDVELRPRGIRVNAVVPQVLDTAGNRVALPADLMAHAVAPEAIAELIAFLVSDAAEPVSGAILPAYGA